MAALQVDGQAALRCWAVTVELGQRRWRIPPTPAEPWITAMRSGDWLDIMPGLLPPAEADEVDDLLDQGAVSVGECERAAQDAVCAAAGMSPWWVPLRLVHSALSDPDAIGELTLAGVLLERVSLGAFTQAAFRLYTRERGARERGRVEQQLMATPEGVSAADAYDEEQAAELFEQMMARRG